MPEKSRSEIPRPLREQYEKGLEAIQRDNLDYAVAIFEQILATEPAFYDCREALRASQFKRASRSGGLLKKLFGAASTSPAVAKAQLALRSDPKEAIRHAEQILNSDPQNAIAHRILADAALACELPKTAVLSLEILHKAAPGDRGITLKLAEALAQCGQLPKAEALMADLSRGYPNDPEVLTTLKNISASRTLSEGGYEKLTEGSGSYRDILRDEAQAKSLEQESQEVKSEDTTRNIIRDYEARAAKEPDNLRLLRSLAELHAESKDYERALDYYRRIIKQEGHVDPSLDKAIAETTARRFDQRIAQLDPAAADHAEQSARLKQEKADYMLHECRQRSEKYPSDLQIRFELGQLLYESGKIPEAIQEFQKAQANPHRRIASLVRLGQCFARRNMHDLAVRSFQNALKEKEVFDDEKKEIYYQLGCSLEALNKPAEAIEQFKAIYEVDIGYRDVAARVEAYYASQ